MIRLLLFQPTAPLFLCLTDSYQSCLLDEQQKAIVEFKNKQKELSEKCQTLEAKIKDAKSVREKELKEAESGITKAKKKADESKKQMEGKYEVS